MAEIVPVTMPKWGLSMAEGKIVHWYVGVGDNVEPGAPLIDIETTKITNTLEARNPGVLRRRIVGEEETKVCGALLGVIAPSDVDDGAIDAFIADFEAHFDPDKVVLEGEDVPEPAFVDVAGKRLRYLTLGEGGDPVLLLHGFSGDLTSYMFNQPRLAENRATIALDLPGHGGSSKDVAGAADLKSMAAVVRGFLDALNLARVHVVGHSMGGGVALALAALAPDRVLSLTLLAPVGLGSEINAEVLKGILGAKRQRELKGFLGQLFADERNVTLEMVDGVLKAKRVDGAGAALDTIAGTVFAGGRQALDLRAALAAYGGPKLVIWGALDKIIPVKHADGIAARLERLEGVGHMPQMEAAQRVNQLIREQIGG